MPDEPKRGGRELAFLAAVALLAALSFAFVELAGAVLKGDFRAFDRAAILALRVPGEPSDPLGPWWFEVAVRDITSLGSTTVVISMAVMVAGYLAFTRRPGTALLIAATIGGGLVLGWSLKQMYERPRPDLVPHGIEVHTVSFPSGHATLSAATYLMLGLVLARREPNRRRKTYILGAAATLVAAVGLSRVYLGVHWPTDVVAGWAVGAGWALLCCWTAFRLTGRGPRGD